MSAAAASAGSEILIAIDQIEPICQQNGIFSCSVRNRDIDECGNLGESSEDDTRMVAMKSFAQSEKSNELDFAHFSRNRDAFRREYELLKSFKDPNSNGAYPYIVSAFIFVETFVPTGPNQVSYGPLFLMELGQRSLYDALKDTVNIPTGDDEGCYSVNHCLTFLRQVCEALAYLHRGIKFRGESKPIIHRDLKSCNILLFNQGRVCKLCDFGVSKSVEAAMTGGIGTPGWVAPEVLKPATDGSYTYTVAADCFSFGAVVLEALFRSLPRRIGHSDDAGAAERSETQRQLESKVNFLCEGRKIVYLSESTFSACETYAPKIPALMALLNGLFAEEPGDRPTADRTLEVLQDLTGGLAELELPIMCGPLAPARLSTQGRDMTAAQIIEPPTTIGQCCNSPSSTQSVFYTIKGQEDGISFDESALDRMKQVMETMVNNLNTRAAGAAGNQGKPCGAKFSIAITNDEHYATIMELRIKQSNKAEPSVVEWCRNSEADFGEFFAMLFRYDTKVCLRNLRFSLRLPDTYEPEFPVGNESDDLMMQSIDH